MISNGFTNPIWNECKRTLTSSLRRPLFDCLNQNFKGQAWFLVLQGCEANSTKRFRRVNWQALQPSILQVVSHNAFRYDPDCIRAKQKSSTERVRDCFDLVWKIANGQTDEKPVNYGPDDRATRGHKNWIIGESVIGEFTRLQ